jgi:hypothetical protein
VRRSLSVGDTFDAPPDTDPAPVECTNCGRLEECDCGTEPDEWDDAGMLPTEGE